MLNPNKPEELVSSIRSILNKKRNTCEICHCERCQQAIAAATPFTCGLCGYEGVPLALACCCYEYTCPGSRSSGFGCPHGSLSCPVCDDGEGDISGWDIVREIRAALGQEVRP